MKVNIPSRDVTFLHLHVASSYLSHHQPQRHVSWGNLVKVTLLFTREELLEGFLVTCCFKLFNMDGPDLSLRLAKIDYLVHIPDFLKQYFSQKNTLPQNPSSNSTEVSLYH